MDIKGLHKQRRKKRYFGHDNPFFALVVTIQRIVKKKCILWLLLILLYLSIQCKAIYYGENDKFSKYISFFMIRDKTALKVIANGNIESASYAFDGLVPPALKSNHHLHLLFLT